MLRFIAWLSVAAGCAGSSRDSRLEAIDPATVTSLAATAATLQGIELDAIAHVDLDSSGATVDRGWRVRIGTTELVAPTWRDRQHLELVIPRGLAAGSHDVVATAPDGRELVLPEGLTVTDEPVGLVLSIEDAAGGTGQPIGIRPLVAGDVLTAHAVIRDRDGAFVVDSPVDWAQTATIGSLANAGARTTLTATTVGRGRLSAHHVGAALDATTGELAVTAGPAARIAIVDAPGAAGAVIGDRSGLTTDGDGGLTAHSVAVDGFGNFVGEVAVAWSLTGVTGVLPGPAATAVVDFTTPGIGTLHADHALGTAATGALDVIAGRAATLAIVPDTLTLDADAAPVAFTVTARDGDGNATTNLGSITWSIASGPITSIAVATGILDPKRAGTGTIGVTSSLGPVAQSGSIVIDAGRAVAITVVPPALTTSADDPSTTFTASAVDADGNATLANAAVTWSVASGPISSIDGSTGTFDPGAAGAGTIAATTVGGAVGTATVSVTPGRAATLAITPDTADVPQGGTAVPFTVTATDADGNATSDLGTITWSVAGPISSIDSSTGVLTPVGAGTGTLRATSSQGAIDDTNAVRIRRAATATPSVAVGAQVSVGQTFAVAMTVANTGEASADNVTACPLAISGAGDATIVTIPSAVATIAAGNAAVLTWTVTATATGAVSFATCASATDGSTGAALTTPATGSTTVLTPPQLVGTLTIPPLLGRGASFDATMIVTNLGQVTASGVVPSALTATGTAAVTLSSAPAGGASIAPGGNATFVWTFVASSQGTIQLHGTASGTDSGAGTTITTPVIDSDIADVVEAHLVANDPFGDGTRFGFVTGYRGEVYLGPNQTGSTAVRFTPDGTNLTTLSFTFTQDVTGSRAENTALPYTSIGATGCTPNTQSCGPDNEDARGLFTGVTIGGTEWLVAQGAKTGNVGNGHVGYLYMTTDADPTLDFLYVDLDRVNQGKRGSSSAIGTLDTTLYIGQAGEAGKQAQLLALTTMPTAPGLDTLSTDLVDLDAGGIPGLGALIPSVEMIDTIATFNGRLYLANRNGWARATVAAPRPHDVGPSDWVDITPTISPYTLKISRTTTKQGDLESIDRAVPQMAAFGGRLFLARNTTSGPQLWSCNPGASGALTQCDAGDWSFIAANSSGDLRLSQFNDNTFTSVTMLVATPAFLYVGFDSANGLRIFRTANPAASIRGDFEGEDGCSAAQHPGPCTGFGGAGLGAPSTNKRIFDAKALTFGTASSVWLTVGDGTSPLALVMLP